MHSCNSSANFFLKFLGQAPYSQADICLQVRMDDDPWGSATADPWSRSTDDAIPTKDVHPADQGLAGTPTPTLIVPPSIPSVAKDIVEDDPWARPSDKALSPLPAIQPRLPDEIPQIIDVPPRAEWNMEQAEGFNTWISTTTVAQDSSSTVKSSGQATQLSPEQIPLPGADGEDLGISHPVEVKAKGVAEAGWRKSEDEEIPLSEISRPLVVEDETFNPFSQNEAPSNGIPDKPMEDFGRASFDDNAFGGFATASNIEFQSSTGFGDSERGDLSQGWGDQEKGSSMSDIDAPWGISSNTNIPDDEEEGFQSSSAAYGYSVNKAASVNDEDGFHSVPSKERESVSAEKLKQDEWEAARREIEMKEARAVGSYPCCFHGHLCLPMLFYSPLRWSTSSSVNGRTLWSRSSPRQAL